MTTYVSTGSLSAKDLHQMVRLAVENGLDLELSSSLSHYPGMLEALPPATGSIRFLVHNYFPPPPEPFVLNLASQNRETLEKSVALCRSAIALCAELSAPFYSVHAGFALPMEPGMLGNPELQREATRRGVDREEAWSTFLASVRQLADFAAGKGVGLLLENNVLSAKNLAADGSHPLLLADPAEIVRFFDELHRPEVGVLLDVGHAKVTARTLGFSPEAFFWELSPVIRALHLSDNDGESDRNDPFDASSWFAPFLARHRDAAMVIEVYRSTLEEILALRSLVAALTGRDDGQNRRRS